MLEALGEKFSHIFNKLKGYGRLTEQNISEALREVRLALLEADVHVAVVKEFLEKVKVRALGQEVIQSLTPHQQFFKIVHEELVYLLGGHPTPFQLVGNAPHVLFLVGLQGSGKTTSTAKLARYLQQKGRRPLLVPADVQRPAAIEQLKTLASVLGIPVHPTTEKDAPVALVSQALEAANDRFCDVVIVDTAGRHQLDEALMQELKSMRERAKDSVVLLVMDAMMGQEALRVSKAFHDLLHVNGLLLTKMDGDARGGALLSARHVIGCPTYFMGVGEKVDQLEPFDPQRLVQRLLDRGDMLGLIEKAQLAFETQDVAAVQKKLGPKFDFEDFRAQLRQVKKLGSLKDLMGFIPGGRSLSQGLDVDIAQKDLAKKEAIINSMTCKERLRPEILNGSRRLRIAQGSGTGVADVNRLLKEFVQLQKMMKQFSKGGMKGLMRGMHR